ncbi:MAG: methyltransferase domain-containing protein [Erysipelotrichaceae bacterium]|jgi:16S rRNA C967 or C1407 C5-methylase (RsmB/RsmF family)/NOL1/NOP2/fmu family ribosome biogenesis protein|nr:methyltransferase domain-containing protein [Erysipelotrichaceae bacterium]
MDFVTALQNTLSLEDAKTFLLAQKEASLPTFFLNKNKLSAAELLARYPKLIPLDAAGYSYLNQDYPKLSKSLEYLAGALYAQDYASSVVTQVLDLKPTDLILDMCAAPGGKTINASIRLSQKGLVIAAEFSKKRLEVMTSNIERLGLGNIITCEINANELPFYFQDCFDKIILDAPCSGTFMFKSEPKMCADWTYNKVLRLQKEQAELLKSGLKMLKVGGYLVYSTCSVLKEENEDIIKAQLGSEYRIIPLTIPGALESSFLPGALRLMPNQYQDGHFICLIQKVSGQTKKFKTTNLNKDEDLSLYKFTTKQVIYGLTSSAVPTHLNFHTLGVSCYEIRGEHRIPMHHLARFLPATSSINLTKEEATTYLRGETLHRKLADGYYIVSFLGLNLGYVKVVLGELKNYYPRGLRIPSFAFYNNYQSDSAH